MHRFLLIFPLVAAVCCCSLVDSATAADSATSELRLLASAAAPRSAASHGFLMPEFPERGAEPVATEPVNTAETMEPLADEPPAPSLPSWPPSDGSHALAPERRQTQQPALRPTIASVHRLAAHGMPSQLPRQSAISSAPPASMRRAKPFEAYQAEPTISPYLNLYRSESDLDAAPNYYAFVRPQLDQQEANRIQQREIQQLRTQLQSVSSNPFGATPNIGIRARYMNTAQYYGPRP